jgi:hypothetical protein
MVVNNLPDYFQAAVALLLQSSVTVLQFRDALADIQMRRFVFPVIWGACPGIQSLIFGFWDEPRMTGFWIPAVSMRF